MTGGVAQGRRGRPWRGIGSTERLSETVHSTLLRTLYAQPVSLVFATLMATVTTVTAAFVSGSGALVAGCIVLALIGLARIATTFGLVRYSERLGTRWLETIYAVGAFAYASAFGTFAATTVYLEMDSQIQTMMIASAIIFQMPTLVFAATADVGMLKVAVDPPAGTVTLAGTAATDGFELVRLTTAPPLGAPLVNVTVP